MAYAAQADLVPGRLTQQELVELTDDAATGEVDTAVVTAKLDEATADIDSYVRGRYALPLVVSDQVKARCLDLAVFKLFQRRRRMPEDVKMAYEKAIAFLRDVSAGKASLDQPGKTQATEMDVVTKDHTDAEQQDVFDDKKLEGF